jgi:hypothetical protein
MIAAAADMPQLTGFILLMILIVAIVAVAAAAGVVGRAAWGLLVSLRRSQRNVLAPAVDLMEQAERLAERADSLAVKAEGLDAAMARLQRDVAALAVLAQTLRTASGPVLRLRAALRK